MQLTVKRQDILESTTDAVVNPVGTNLNMTSSISQQIQDRCEGSVYDDVQQFDPVSGGDAIVTHGYEIAEYLIHAVTSPGEDTRGQNIRASVNHALNIADKLACSDIAIPALGTGKAGFEFATSVKIIGETIDAYSSKRISSAHIVCNEKQKYNLANELCSQTKTPWVDRQL